MNKISSKYQCVKEFHEQFGHPTSLHLDYSRFEDSKLLKLRIDLIKEEVRELKEAIDINDTIETIDALCDILYVVHGAAVVFGIDMDHQDIIFVDDLEPQSVVFHLNKMLGLLELAFKEKNMDGVIYQLCSMVYLVKITGEKMKLPIDKAFHIVHDSNMSKICDTEKDAIETVKHYSTLSGFENVIVNYKVSPDGRFVIYNEKSGKILKSMFWKEPNFDSII